MVLLRSISRLLCLLLACVSLQGSRAGTMELTQRDFDQVIQKNSMVLVMFYAPWCYWSRLLAPEFDTAEQQLALHDPPVKLAKVDATANFLLQEKYSINEYPTVKFFTDGKIHEYDGGRTASEIVSWVNRMADKDHVLDNQAELDKFLSNSQMSVVAVFPNQQFDRSVYLKISRHYEDVTFAESRDPNLADALFSKYKVPKPRGYSKSATPLVVMFTPYSATDAPQSATPQTNGQPGGAGVQLTPVVFEGDAKDMTEFDKFVNANRFPLLSAFDPNTASRMFDDGRPILFLVKERGADTDPAKQTTQKALEAAAKKVAAEFRGQVLFAVTGVEGPHEKRLADMIGIEEEERLPAVRIVTSNPGGHGHWMPALKYKLETRGQLPSEKEFRKFLLDFTLNTLEPYFKSEPKPEYQPGPVTVVVGSTFKQVVFDRRKDVLIEFYAPWCGHCRKLEPAYKDLARKLSGISTIVVAKIDATRNEIPDLNIRAYPTLLFYPANRKDAPEEFVGDRSTEHMLQFLSEKATFKFDPQNLPQKKQRDAGEDGLLAEIEL